MADIPIITRKVQVGDEATAGTNVAADVRLRSYQFTFDPQSEFRDFRASGDKGHTQEQYLREWTNFSIDGLLDYNELVFPLSSAVDYAGTPTAGASTAAGSAHQWTFELDNTAADTPKTYSMEVGDGSEAQEVSYGLFDSVEISVENNVSSLTATGFAQKFTTGISLTGSPNTVPASGIIAPMLPSHFKVYLDTTSSADFGTTELNRAFSAVFAMSNRYAMLWPVDSDNNSTFAAHIESEVDVTFTLQLMADDAVGWTPFTDMRAGNTNWLRLEAVGGSTVGGAGTDGYRMTLDFAGQIMDAPDLGDRDSALMATWVYRGVVDPNWGSGKAFSIYVQNELRNLAADN